MMQSVLNKITWSRFKCILNISHTSHLKLVRKINIGSSCPGKQPDALSRQYIKKGPGLEYFIYNSVPKSEEDKGSNNVTEKHPYLSSAEIDGHGLKGKLREIPSKIIPVSTYFLFSIC